MRAQVGDEAWLAHRVGEGDEKAGAGKRRPRPLEIHLMSQNLHPTSSSLSLTRLCLSVSRLLIFINDLFGLILFVPTTTATTA
jgi:hypothetical protein